MLLPFQRFYRVYSIVGLFVLVILFGTAGYMLIEHYSFLDALFMTIITLSTVGYGEVKPLSLSGKIFTIILIIANIGTFTYLITQISKYFFDGEFIQAYKSYKMKNAINELTGHVIICGFGRNGRAAAQHFLTNKSDFVIVEKQLANPENPALPVKYYIEDDATRDETLLQAGVKKARALITSLPDDSDNLFVVLTARELNPGIKIISRASNDSSVKKIKIAGADNVIMPDKIGGAQMAALVLSPDVKEFTDLLIGLDNKELDMVEITSNRTTTLADLDCWKKTGSTVLGLKTGAGKEYILNPSPQTALGVGDSVIVMGSEEQIEKVRGLLR
jgi:voltage-gated potassium channel